MKFSYFSGAPLAMLAAGLISLAVALPVPAQTATADVATERLFNAVRANDFAAVQESVSDGAMVDYPGPWGMTPIDVAIDKGYFDIAHFLVSVRNFANNAADEAENASASATSGDATNASDAGPGAGPGATDAEASTVYTMQPQDTLLKPATGPNDAAMAAVPDWPSDKPHPFDPAAPAPGSTRLSVIGEIGATSSSSGDGAGESDGTRLQVFGQYTTSAGAEARAVSRGDALESPVIGATKTAATINSDR